MKKQILELAIHILSYVVEKFRLQWWSKFLSEEVEESIESQVVGCLGGAAFMMAQSSPKSIDIILSKIPTDLVVSIHI